VLISFTDATTGARKVSMRSNHSRRQRIVNFTGSLASLLEGGVSPALACATNRTAPRLAATRPDLTRITFLTTRLFIDQVLASSGFRQWLGLIFQPFTYDRCRRDLCWNLIGAVSDRDLNSSRSAMFALLLAACSSSSTSIS
jgi:hypothetical protein